MTPFKIDKIITAAISIYFFITIVYLGYLFSLV